MQRLQAESYTATISHEMRTPLGSVLFFLHMIISILMDRYRDTAFFEIEKYLSMIEGQLTLMQTFVSDLIDIKTLQEGVFTLQNEPFNVVDTLSGIFQVFKPQAVAKGLVLGINYRDTVDENLTLVGDKRRFTQVMINLIRNALKFTLKGHI